MVSYIYRKTQQGLLKESWLMKNDAIPLPELKKQYYPAKDIALVEETDQEKARSLFESKCSCCWGNTIIGDTGWAWKDQKTGEVYLNGNTTDYLDTIKKTEMGKLR